MEYPVTNIPGLEGRKIIAKSAGVISPVNLIVDGAPAKPAKKGGFVVTRDDGTDVNIQVKSSWPDPMPRLLVDNQKILLGQPFKWYESLFIFTPFLLVAIGGLIGALIGAIATAINGRLFRTSWHPAIKYLAVVGVGFLAYLGYLVVVVFLVMFRQG